ncbi:DUF3380 domain-containing protein [Chryseobacterium carnipullorum]|uniref:N-acetylmuramidase domain-containing protein n=1 Tax=Chryseobacterium carnipullorum TaxID=1124835 RepID=UPI000F4D978D|nr:N-acetylmuramidase domain-containing protein [Chryseobacterium carnipullorum]AZA64465.1 DUF3380 domain-containing protein [Chryseobacterium carnipullorum]
MKTLTEQDYINAAKELGCEVAAIKAVAEVESRGSGFLSSGEPKILFERHRFYKYTNGKYYNKKKLLTARRLLTLQTMIFAIKLPEATEKNLINI